MATATWTPTDGPMRLSCGLLSAELDPARPGEGISAVRWEAAPVLTRLFALETPVGPLPAAAESYVRGADALSIHPATDAFPFRTQLGWSARELFGGGVAVLLTLSLQTDLLDTRPGLTLVTRPADAGRIGEHAFSPVRLTPPGGQASAYFAPHPTDTPECRPEIAGDTLRVGFSPPFLEKGVIRRARFAALVLPGEPDDSALGAAFDAFASWPLPLNA